MPGTSKKPFDSIHGDYSFFQRHSTEAEADIGAYVPRLLPFLKKNRPIRMLDFGCGDGAVTAEILDRLSISPSLLHIALVEPDVRYRNDSQKRLGRFTAHPVSACAELPRNLDSCFDIIISNNVLYYVIDLKETLAALVRARARSGFFIASMAGRGNALVKYTFPFFARMGKPYPFWLAEECQETLSGLGEIFGIEEVGFKLVFPDSEENRLSMARFLLGGEYQNVPRGALLEGFDQYRHEGKIVIRTFNKHLIVRG